MKLRTVLLAGVAVLALTAPARADFIITPLLFAGSALFATGTTTIAGLSLSAFASAAFAVASMVATAMMGQKADTSKIKNTVQGSEGPGFHAFGRVELAGQVLYGNTKGMHISRLVGHAFGVLDRVEAYLYDGREITVEPDGYVSTPPWSRPSGAATPSYMQVWTQVGDGTEVAHPTLVSDFSQWTADHAVKGIANSLMRILNPGAQDSPKKFARLLQGGVKALSVRARMLKPYDPRTASNTWTMNGVLHVLHYLRALNGVSDADLDLAGIGAVATQGEALVATLTGTAPRCQLSGGWQGPITTDIVLDMLESAGLEMTVTDDGKETLRFVEDWPEPEITLRLNHIIDNHPQAGPESAKRPNVCKLTYFSPERRFEKAEIDLTDAPWARVQDEIDAFGDQEFACDLTFCCDASQAQRIARRLFLMARADFGMLKTTWAGMACWGKRTGLIEIPDVGEDGAPALVRVRFGSVRPNDADGTCEIPYQIIPDELATPWNPATMEVAPPPLLLPQVAESDLATPGTPTEAVQVVYPDTTREIRVTYPNPGQPGGGSTEAVYRIWDADGPTASVSMTEVAGAGGVPFFAWSAGNAEGDKVDFRVRVFNSDGDGSYFSAPLVKDPLAIDHAPIASVNIASTRVLIESGGLTLAYDRVNFSVLALRCVAYQVGGGPVVPCRPGSFQVDVGPVPAEDPAATYLVAFTS